MGDEPVGGAENIGAAPIIVFERDDRGRGVVAFEFQNVADARPPPPVDRLIGVACHREVWVIDRESTHDAILHRVGVLVFVNQDPAVPGVEHVPQVGIVHQHAGHVHEQIVEIDRVRREEHLLVHGPNPLGHLIHRTAPAGLERIGREEIVLGPADHPCHTIDRRVGERQSEFLGGPLEQRAGVVGVEDRVVAREAGEPGVSAEETGGEPMKCSHLDRLRSDELRHTATHLVCGFVRERQRHDLLGRDTGKDQVRDPVCHDACLAAPWPC